MTLTPSLEFVLDGHGLIERISSSREQLLLLFGCCVGKAPETVDCIGLYTALDAWPAFSRDLLGTGMAQGRIIGAQQYAIVLRINAYASHSQPSEIQMSQQHGGEIETSGRLVVVQGNSKEYGLERRIEIL